MTWSGVGVALKTDTPSAAQVRSGVAAVLADRQFAERARAIATAYAG